MSDWKAKRFWKSSALTEVADGFGVALDGRAIKTPAKAPLILPTRAMAQAVAAEWDAQDGTINPATMPCTRTANAAIDKVALQHAEVADMLAAYGDSDLLCYRADHPEGLVARQSTQWDPMLDWAETTLGARLLARTGVIHAPQSAAVLERLSGQVHGLDNFQMAAFHDLVSLSGSLILGFAATHDAKPVADLWDLSQLDENWQIEQWGKDDDAAALTATKQEAFFHAKRMFDLTSV